MNEQQHRYAAELEKTREALNGPVVPAFAKLFERTNAERVSKDSPQLSRSGPEVTHIGMRQLTRLQEDVLWIVDEYGPVTCADVDYHLNLDRGRSRSVLTALERRSLVDATYTAPTSDRNRSGVRAFVTTSTGAAVVSREAE